jgi:hypothetical protein
MPRQAARLKGISPRKMPPSAGLARLPFPARLSSERLPPALQFFPERNSPFG